MDEKEQQIAHIVEALQKLPEKAQEAICWAITHIDAVEQLTQKSTLSEQELRAIVRDALKDEDYLMLALALHQQMKGENLT